MPRRGSQLAGGPARIAVTGSLTPFAVGFREALTGQGFARWAVAQHTHLLAHLNVWLAERGLTAEQLGADELRAFVLARRADGHGFLISQRGMAPLLRYLRGRGVVAEPGLPTPFGPVEVLLVEYRGYLMAERSLAPLSVARYLGTARLFLSFLPVPVEVSLRELSAEQVTDFLVAEVGVRRAWAAKSLVTALRSLLGFLHVAGYLPRPLVAALLLGGASPPR